MHQGALTEAATDAIQYYFKQAALKPTVVLVMCDRKAVFSPG